MLHCLRKGSGVRGDDGGAAELGFDVDATEGLEVDAGGQEAGELTQENTPLATMQWRLIAEVGAPIQQATTNPHPYLVRRSRKFTTAAGLSLAAGSMPAAACERPGAFL